MSKKEKEKELGIIGEGITCHYLVRKGYKIVEKNMKNFVGEIDIVAQKDDMYVFVEVKTRDSVEYGLPLEAITSRKQKKIRDCAATYLKHKGLYNKVFVRFDCVSIIGADDNFKIEHLENIF